jgi:hypothetical protein
MLLIGMITVIDDSSFKYSLQVFNLYTKKHLGVIPSERIEHILKDMMETMHAYSNVDDQESKKNFCLVGEKCLIWYRFGEKLPAYRNHDKPNKNTKHCVAI